MFKDIKKHPSYGMIGFKRVSHSGATPLFGSSIQHRDTIIMTLKHGQVERHLNRDWYSGNGIISEVEMSYSQFAEAISAMNIGDGVPCTVRFTEKDGTIKSDNFVGKHNQFQKEFSDHLSGIKKRALDTITRTTEIFAKKSIGKRDKEEILSMLQQLETQIGSNTEFIYRQFNQQMDKTITEAKGEIEAFYQNKLNSIAQAALVEHKDEFKMLEKPVEME